MKCTSKKRHFSVLSGRGTENLLRNTIWNRKEKLCSQRKNYNFSNQPRRFAKIVCNRIVRVVFGPKKIPLNSLSSITNIEKKCAIEYWRCLCLFHNWMIVRVGYAPREVCQNLPKSSERTKGAKRRSSDGAGTASGKNDNSHQTNS